MFSSSWSVFKDVLELMLYRSIFSSYFHYSCIKQRALEHRLVHNRHHELSIKFKVTDPFESGRLLLTLFLVGTITFLDALIT